MRTRGYQRRTEDRAISAVLLAIALGLVGALLLAEWVGVLR